MTHPGGLTMVSNDNEPNRPGAWVDRIGMGGPAAAELIASQGIGPGAVEVPGSAEGAVVLSTDQRDAVQRSLMELVALQQPPEAQAAVPLDGPSVAQVLMESSREGLPLRHERLAALLGVDPENCAAIRAEASAYGFRLRRLGQRRGSASALDRSADRRPWVASW